MKVVTFGEILSRLTPPGFQPSTHARKFEGNVAVS